MIMLTTTYDVPTTSPSSSATTQFTLGKKRNKTHKKKKYSQEAAGALSPPTPPSYSLSPKRGNIFCQRATAGTKQSLVLFAPI
jgi:hypothetical protein